MTEVKKTRGRPRKVQPVDNPDCKTATKGYVKCLLRHLIQDESSHYHELKEDTLTSTLGASSIFGIILTLSGFALTMGKSDLLWLCSMFASSSLIFGVIIIACLFAESTTKSGRINDGEIPPAFEKYKVVCAPKKGCE